MPSTRNVAVRPARSRKIVGWLIGSAVVTLAALMLLAAIDVPLGQGFFFYRYSSFREARTVRALAIAPVALGAVASVVMLGSAARSLRRAGLGLLLLCAVGASAWIWWAPPLPWDQQAFTFRNMSSDGAFVTESEGIRSVSDYLRAFDERLKLPPEKMGGTRVLSNPPGFQVFCHWVTRAVPVQLRPVGEFEQKLISQHEVRFEDLTIVVNSLRVSFALTIVYVAACAAAYVLGRAFLSPAGAGVFAILLMFNPAVVHFTPGKDSAQLLTICLMLAGWFWGIRTQSHALCALAGGVLAIGSTLGLIHLWVAVAAVAATALTQRKAVLACALSSAAGALLVMGAVWMIVGWNIPLTLLAVSRKFSELQPTFQRSKTIWFFIGLPLFLLFLNPGFWALLARSFRCAHMQAGSKVFLCTTAVMLLTYVIGLNYELPRLWTAFLPLLTLSVMIDRPMFRSQSKLRAGRLIAIMVLVQIAFTAIHWTLLDVRESEYRILSGRLYQ